VLSAGFDVWWGLAYDVRPRLSLVSDIALGVCFVIAGTAAWRLRPRSRTGALMLLLGVMLLLANPYGFHVAPGAPGAMVVEIAGEPMYWLQFAVAAHLFLSYPSGRLRRGSAEHRFVAACYVLVLLTSAAVLILSTDRELRSDWYDLIHAIVLATWICLGGLAVVLLICRVLRSSPRRRRQEAFALVAVGSAITLFAAVFATTLAVGGDKRGDTMIAILHTWMAWTGVIAVPVAFFVGLFQERLAFASVGVLVRRLENVGPDTVEAALAEILHDPTLHVVFPIRDGFLDVDGRSYVPLDDSASARTPVGAPPTAILIHDSYLAEDRQLLDAAAAAAGLALDNARLNAEVRAQLDEVRASRHRIAAAADVERQRLERDLHDGAQQRLLGIGYMLGALRTRLDDPGDRQLVSELELELRGAIGELRNVAQHIRPAVLTDQGLGPALASLARRSPIAVTLSVSLRKRLDPVVEATAYHVVSEALRHVADHSEDVNVCVSAMEEAGWLTVRVTDDHVSASGDGRTGLLELADWVNAVDGSWEVTHPSGGGTTIAARLPCEPGSAPLNGSRG
jgi:signal transduction histidine kinase